MPSNRPPNPPPVPRWQWLPWRGEARAEQLARDWLAPQLGCAASAIPLQRDRYGRPRLLAPFEREDAGWSHSGEGLLVAVARDQVVGVDLERERPRPRALELARRFFQRHELDWIAAQPDPAARERAFLRLWCAKEAVLKAHGRGLVFGLHRLGFAERDGTLVLVDSAPELGAAAHWRLQEFIPAPGYRAAIAWRPAAATGTAA